MNIKTNHIVIGIVAALVLLLVTSLISVNNVAVGYEQTIDQSQSGITVQEKRQHDLILQLIQVVEQASQYEAGVQENIAQLRTAAQSGNDQQAQFYLAAVAEAYPQLQANSTYVQLMTEMSVSENLVTNYRNKYNEDVRNYKRFTQRFPANIFLGMVGHKIVDYPFLTFTTDSTQLPDNLFGQ